jgi:hypothetical protein
MREEAAARFRFKIDDAFTITGRGTAVVGFIEQGAVRVGDRLQLIRSDGNIGPVIACRSVEFVDRTGWRPGDPVTVGLIVAGLSEQTSHAVTRCSGKRLRPRNRTSRGDGKWRQAARVRWWPRYLRSSLSGRESPAPDGECHASRWNWTRAAGMRSCSRASRVSARASAAVGRFRSRARGHSRA